MRGRSLGVFGAAAVLGILAWSLMAMFLESEDGVQAAEAVTPQDQVADPAARMPASADSELSLVHDEQTAVLAIPPSPADGFASAAEFLASYWGDEWKAVREANHLKDDWLARIDLRELRPWGEVEKDAFEHLTLRVAAREDSFIASRLRCEDTRGSIDLLRETLDWKTAERAHTDFETVRDVAREQREKLTRLAHAYQAELTRAISRQWEVEVEHHPIVLPIEPTSEDTLHREQLTFRRWCYCVTLTETDYPDLAGLAAELEAARFACLNEIDAVLAAGELNDE